MKMLARFLITYRLIHRCQRFKNLADIKVKPHYLLQLEKNTYAIMWL